MKPNIIFITSTTSNSHCKNRIEQFIQQGYKVHVYSFRRDKETTPENLPYKMQQYLYEEADLVQTYPPMIHITKEFLREL